MFTVTSKIHF